MNLVHGVLNYGMMESDRSRILSFRLKPNSVNQKTFSLI